MSHPAVLVLGGGPAGSMCAMTLAEAGRSVTLLEKSKEAHDKVCGEFLSRESGALLERFGLHPRTLGAVPIETVRLVTPWFTRERPLPFAAWSLTRKRLDEALLTEAERRGVCVCRGAHATALEQAGESWRVELRDCTAQAAENVVLATGKLDLGGWARPEGKQPGLVAFKMYYRLTETERNALRGAVELVLFRGGYAGLQAVQDGVANLCLLVDARRLQATGLQWETVIRHVLEHAPHLRKRLEAAEPLLQKPLAASRIPYGHLQREAEGGLWRVGDQAAVIPSFSGDGTAIALHSGALAAKCLLRGEGAAEYQAKLHAQLRRPMWLATRLSRTLIEHPKASEVARLLPVLIRTVATLTRIPDSALMETA